MAIDSNADSGRRCIDCSEGEYQPFLHNVNYCLRCERGTYAPSRGQSSCEPCPVLGPCMRNITFCDRITGGATEASFYPDNMQRCRAANTSDPCDAHTYCLSYSLSCPDPERLPMAVDSLARPTSYSHQLLLSAGYSTAAGPQLSIQLPAIPAKCGEKAVVPRYQYLVTRCDERMSPSCENRCLEGLVGKPGGLQGLCHSI